MTNLMPSEACQKARDLHFLLLEGEPLPSEEAAFLKAHETECPACLAYRQTLKNLTGSLRDLANMPVPAGLEDRIMAGLTQSGNVKASMLSSRKLRLNWKLAAPIAAAILLLAVTVPMLNRFQPDDTHQETSEQLAQQHPPIHHGPIPADDERFIESSPDAMGNPYHPSNSSYGQAPGHPPAQNIMAESPNSNHFQPQERNQAAFSGSGDAEPPVWDNRNDAQPQATDDEPVELASLGSMPFGAEMQNVFSSDTENDVYYDPTSSLVGF